MCCDISHCIARLRCIAAWGRNCIAGRGLYCRQLAGEGSVSRYKFCIVTKAARLD